MRSNKITSRRVWENREREMEKEKRRGRERTAGREKWRNFEGYDENKT
jgi:hypothetical protein